MSGHLSFQTKYRHWGRLRTITFRYRINPSYDSRNDVRRFYVYDLTVDNEKVEVDMLSGEERSTIIYVIESQLDMEEKKVLEMKKEAGSGWNKVKRLLTFSFK